MDTMYFHGTTKGGASWIKFYKHTWGSDEIPGKFFTTYEVESGTRKEGTRYSGGSNDFEEAKQELIRHIKSARRIDGTNYAAKILTDTLNIQENL